MIFPDNINNIKTLHNKLVEEVRKTGLSRENILADIDPEALQKLSESLGIPTGHNDWIPFNDMTSSEIIKALIGAIQEEYPDDFKDYPSGTEFSLRGVGGQSLFVKYPGESEPMQISGSPEIHDYVFRQGGAFTIR